MSFFKNLFNSFIKTSITNEEKIEKGKTNSIDDLFVSNFIKKGGKFLYCTTINEVKDNLKNIIYENNWKKILCYDNDLLKLLDKIKINTEQKFSNYIPFFTTCEHLIGDCGNILVSSNQIGSNKIHTFSNNFIVYATTSQLVKNTSEGLTGINTRYKGNIPTNISAIRNYSMDDKENLMYYSNSNSKNLYLIFFEDL